MGIDIDKLSCLLDLHIHLDGSISLDSYKKLAEIQGIKVELSDDELIKKLQVPEGCKDLNEYLDKFEFPLKVLQTKETISESVKCLIDEQTAGGVMYSEIRFAPQLHTNSGLTQEEVVEAAISGLKKSDIKMHKLILCCMRGDNNKEENLKTVEVAKKYLNKGVVAVDLAGAEGLFPTYDFKDVFEKATAYGIPLTVHAGEADGPESVDCAVRCGASRIGHGVRAWENDAVLQELIDGGIPLEMCPTSNLNTKLFNDISQYPLVDMYKKGVKVTVNTDNMTVSDTNIKKELKLLVHTFNIDDIMLKDILFNGVEASFADGDTKILMRKRIEAEFGVGYE
ncbi:MAG: adenosine deaminase [Eubacteriales bacterium]|nr:adenosine deaminase [Eubacteriales bacterium]